MHLLGEKEAYLQGLLSEVLHEMTRLNGTIQQHRVLLSPIRKLPNELLERIFLLCLSPGSMVYQQLARVCRRWRTIVHNTALLWSNLTIPPLWIRQSQARTVNQKKILDFIEESLRRSGERQLTLAWETDSCLTRTEINIVTGMILPHCHRWRELSLILRGVSQDSVLRALQGLAVSRIACLTSVRLVFGDTILADAANWIHSPLLNAPNLRSVYISRLPYRLVTVHPDWSSLTDLSYFQPPDSGSGLFWSRFKARDAYNVLRRCHQLVTCSMVIQDNDDPEALISEIQSVDLPFLQSLEIFARSRSIPALFQSFYAPALKTIKYIPYPEPSFHSRIALLSLLASNGGQIQNLEIDVMAFTHADLVRSLTLTPLVRHVKSVNHPLQKEFASPCINYVQALLNVLSPPVCDSLCPLLRDLDLGSLRDLRIRSGSGYAAPSSQGLRDFLDARTNLTVNHLRRVAIPATESADKDGLIALSKEFGVSIVVT